MEKFNGEDMMEYGAWVIMKPKKSQHYQPCNSSKVGFLHAAIDHYTRIHSKANTFSLSSKFNII